MATKKKFLGIFDLDTTTGMKVEVRDSESGISLKSFKKIGEAHAFAHQLMQNDMQFNRHKVHRIKSSWEAWKADAQTLNNINMTFPKKFSVNERFHFFEQIVGMVLEGEALSSIICGPPGIGKTHTVFKKLADAGMEEGFDYIVVKGNISPLGLFRTLQENADKIVVMDDTDSCLFNAGCVNLLKAALDNYSTRTITWSSFVMDKIKDLEDSFEFKGKIIFISNMPQEKIDSAIRSRSFCLDLQMDTSDILEHLENLADQICEEMPKADLEKIMNFIREHVPTLKELNIRTLQKLAVIYKAGSNWQKIAEYMYCN
jgi:hypothetical protein